MKLLYENQANLYRGMNVLEFTNSEGYNAVWLSLCAGDVEILRWLAFDVGVDLGMASPMGDLGVLMAAYSDNVDCLEVGLEACKSDAHMALSMLWMFRVQVVSVNPIWFHKIDSWASGPSGHDFHPPRMIYM